MPYDATLVNDRDKVRLLIADTDDANPIFQDAELNGLLSMELGDVLRAAAQALDIIGSNQLMVLKVIKLLDLQTDGAKVAAEFRARAKDLRDQSASTATFDWAEVVYDDPTARERLLNDWLRTIGQSA